MKSISLLFCLSLYSCALAPDGCQPFGEDNFCEGKELVAEFNPLTDEEAKALLKQYASYPLCSGSAIAQKPREGEKRGELSYKNRLYFYQPQLDELKENVIYRCDFGVTKKDLYQKMKKQRQGL